MKVQGEFPWVLEFESDDFTKHIIPGKKVEP